MQRIYKILGNTFVPNSQDRLLFFLLTCHISLLFSFESISRMGIWSETRRWMATKIFFSFCYLSQCNLIFWYWAQLSLLFDEIEFLICFYCQWSFYIGFVIVDTKDLKEKTTFVVFSMYRKIFYYIELQWKVLLQWICISDSLAWICMF